ncbi:endolytic transglycosylase MltG [uncultured Gemella sp.]|uniref:endolytic transglycosylase MltG n=1 Tax=uncultured Gemella sp. TaxID=254352 RepID=UPI0028D03D1C|nr:endolytic transglycosylase MltG [uncultured Gemella sp.]
MKEDKIRRSRELRRKNKKKKSFIPTILTIIVVLGITALSVFYYMITPVDKSNNKDISVEIKENYGSAKIAQELKSKGLIKNEEVFKIYSRLSPNTSFYVGKFKLKQSMSLPQIIQELGSKNKANSGNTFALIEGDSILKISKNLEKTKLNKDEFLEKVNDAEFIKKLQKQFPELITNEVFGKDIKYALEGYLYPAIYDLSDNETVESLITKMVKLTNEKVVPLYQKNNKSWKINGQQMQISIHDYITMASILEKESTKSDENKLIASVFLNRLAQGMKLQTDPSANYAADKLTGAPTQTELTLNSPYNTYVIVGLPPGPISSVGSASYEALNNAENTDYLYFLHATKDGKAYFSKTYAEHEALAKEHIEGYIPAGN